MLNSSFERLERENPEVESPASQINNEVHPLESEDSQPLQRKLNSSNESLYAADDTQELDDRPLEHRTYGSSELTHPAEKNTNVIRNEDVTSYDDEIPLTQNEDNIRAKTATSEQNSANETSCSTEEKPSIWERLGNFFSHKETEPVSEEEQPRETHGSWEGMETAPAPNGSGWTVLPGNHFDEYTDVDLHYSDHPRVAIPKDEQVYTLVNPDDIEGVYLGDTELESPENFWNMHSGSKEAWMDTASHIPEVQQRLNNGESLDNLLEDDQLGPCANAYFNPHNSQAIEVDAMANGGYLFNGNGRHRIIAARSYGYEIPVKIVGQRE